MSVPIVRLGRGWFVLLAVALFAAPAPGQADAPGVTWDERIEVASGGGYRGPWRMNESEYDYVDDPTVAIDARGFVGIAWADQSGHDDRGPGPPDKARDGLSAAAKFKPTKANDQEKLQTTL